jgi:hypothetical protein
MITEKEAQHAILPLVKANLSFPPEKDGRASLSAMLAQYARSVEHARSVIETWIRENPEWPKPSHLHDLCIEVADPAVEIASERRGRCRYCNGDGFISVDAQYGLSRAMRCTHGPEMADVTHANLKIPRALESHYMAEQREADKRAEAWVGSGGKPNAEALKSIMGRL